MKSRSLRHGITAAEKPKSKKLLLRLVSSSDAAKIVKVLDKSGGNFVLVAREGEVTEVRYVPPAPSPSEQAERVGAIYRRFESRHGCQTWVVGLERQVIFIEKTHATWSE